MSLSTYQKKRDFKQTREPGGNGKKSEVSGPGSARHKLRFVVQRHHASSLHYDFRLELDGVLKSWAVPKGPSLNPKDKRLAMMVEDHPFAYRTFEGEIPKGNYGAGTVMVWDEGTYESLAEKRADDVKELHKGLKSGDLKIRLKGKILKGEFALVRMKTAGENGWLLIKHKDDESVTTKFDPEKYTPEKERKAGIEFKKGKTDPKKKEWTAGGEKKKSTSATKKQGENSSLNTAELQEEEEIRKLKKGSEIKPMLATLAAKVFDHDDWIFERKLDGYRILSHTGKTVKLVSRNGIDYTQKYQPLSDALAEIGADAVIDGELVVEDKKGNSFFQLLQHYDPEETKEELRYYVFDLPVLNGYDLRQFPLIKRKELLKQLVSPLKNKMIVFNDHVEKQGEKLLEKARKGRWEGIIGKERSSVYASGRRSDQWLKFKLQNSQETLICGYTKPGGSRKHFGALVLGIRDGDTLRYAGNCGTGFRESDLKELHALMQKRERKMRTVPEKVNMERNVTWIRPDLIAEVEFTEWTKDGHLRHPSFKGLRKDKAPKSVVMEKPKETKKEGEISIGRKTVKLSNQDKIFWEKEKLTKGDVVDFYRTVSGRILPFLKDRPMSMLRHPNGASKPGFFQKDVDTEHLPGWAKTTTIRSDSTGKDVHYLLANDEATLVYMANLGCIEINPWLSTYKKPGHPVFMVIDLDPQEVPFPKISAIARAFHELFDQMDIPSFVKTSGSRGIHIYVHVGGKYPYETVRQFAEYCAHQVHAEHSTITSLERSPSKRKKKIYLDYLQNAEGQTIAAPYSVRPRPGATVSTPLDWKEVNDALDPKKFTIRNFDERLKKADPWKDIFSAKADLRSALKKLRELQEKE
ncbi:MAG: DNA ligase D [Mucilaginibacter polytrichastri]|nr:DNA ligase D [Mucilaginibacter polytrichastri]